MSFFNEIPSKSQRELVGYKNEIDKQSVLFNNMVEGLLEMHEGNELNPSSKAP